MLKHIVEKWRANSEGFPTLDSTTPWYNFSLYIECCNSLGFKPSITSYIRYNEYYKALFTE
jgi:hypothetical protein